MDTAVVGLDPSEGFGAREVACGFPGISIRVKNPLCTSLTLLCWNLRWLCVTQKKECFLVE